MNHRTSLFLSLIAAFCFQGISHCESPQAIQNLLCNPTFGFRSSEPSTGKSHNVTCWNTEGWGDITAVENPEWIDDDTVGTGHWVQIRPGKSFWQFAALPDLGVSNGATLSLAANGFQLAEEALQARVCCLSIESEDGEWTPTDWGMSDKRTFAKQGRGELVRSSVKQTSSSQTGQPFLLKLPPITLDASFELDKKSSSEHNNLVGILVEFENVSDQPVWVNAPTLISGKDALIETALSRPMPDHYRQIPRTIQKLTSGQPLHILTLGSSIDRGSANPRMYLYQEDSTSPQYKEPLSDCRKFPAGELDRLLAEHEYRPDLQGYIGWWQHYFMYTGRMRLELMRKFDYPIDKLLLNVMACDGSSIGESHSGFRQYAELELDPDPNTNGHPTGKSWNDLYPSLFVDGNSPAPDLVVFGHGHNEHIDHPDEIAAYEGAIRWFQKHYPQVEFLSCMWIRDKGKEHSMTEPMSRLCDHYGIPFVDVGQTLIGLQETSNRYSLAPDGGHPSAATHYLWFKQLEKMFEIPENAQTGIPQKHLPARMNPYAYAWEGDMKRWESGDPRLVNNKMMMIEDCTFNVWVENKKPVEKKDGGKEEVMLLNVDGKPAVNAGHGRHVWKKPDSRNSTFVHGHLSLGDRHILEVLNPDAKLIAVDGKIAPGRQFFAADSDQWIGKRLVEPYLSTWGAPLGDKAIHLASGESIEIVVEATDLSLAYADDPEGGDLILSVGKTQVFTQPTDVPFIDSNQNPHFIENRRGVRGLAFGKHRVRLQANKGPVIVLGVLSYDRR